MMNRSITPRSAAAVALAVCLACFTPAEAKRPDRPGGSDGGGDKGTSYQIVRLDTDDGSGGTVSGTAFDINDSRLIVGSVIQPIGTDTVSRAVCWTVTEVDGTLASTLHFLDDFPFTHTLALGCNESGEIVGHADDGGTVNAVYWADKNSFVEPLPAPLVLSEAQEINDSGVICGWSWDGIGGSNGELKALVWSFSEGEWKYFELAPQGDPGRDENGNALPNQSLARDISEADPETGLVTIVGRSNGNAVAWTVILDDSGALVAGPATILDPNAEATGTNNAGTICGWGHLGPSSGGDGVVWVEGGPAELLTPIYWKWSGNPQQVWPDDVNDGGLIVGHAFNQAIFWPNKDAPPTLLDDFLPKGKHATFYSLTDAHAVNESDEIVGRGSMGENSPSPPFLAIPK